MRKLPIPFPLIEKMEDRPLVGCLLKRMPQETDQFLYGKYYPLFKKLYIYYNTDCLDEVELTDEIYLHIMKQRPPRNTSRLEDFNFQCHLAWWMKIVSINFCHTKWQKHRELTFFESTEEIPTNDKNSMSVIVNIEREDFENLLNMMHNERYRKLMQYHYLDDLSHEETAQKMGEKMSDYYRTHERARRQFKEVFIREMKIQ